MSDCCRISLTAAIACIAGCASAPPPNPATAQDAQFTQASASAMTAYDRGDPKTADRLFQIALTRAEFMDDSEAIADAAYNLAACEIALRRDDLAARHLDEALYSIAQRGGDTDGVRLLMAKLAYLRRQYTDAESIAKELVDSKSPSISVSARTLLTLIACDQGNLASAKSRLAGLQEAIAAHRNIGPSVTADEEKAEGLVERLKGNAHAAAEHFDKETDLLRAAHRYADIVHSLSRSAAAHADAGESAVAADKYYQAARQCRAMGDPAVAQKLADAAKALAKSAGDVAAERRISLLISEIAPTTAP